MATSETTTPLNGSEPDRAQASDLCTTCGLCCMSAIHRTAVLEEDEVAEARRVGLPVLDQPDRHRFALPCPKLSGTRCTIFGHRPSVCGRYRCQLLSDHIDGKIDLDAATERVAQAIQLFRALQSLLPEGMTVGEARLLANRNCEPPVPIPANSLMETRLRAVALELYLDKHFRNEKDGRTLEMKSVDDR